MCGSARPSRGDDSPPRPRRVNLFVDIVVVLLVCGTAAMVQAMTGFGFGLVAVPLLALLIDPVQAVVVATLVSLVLTTLVSRRERAHVVGGPALRMTIGGFVGMPLGLLALLRLESSALQIVIAVVIAVLVVLLWLGVRGGTGVAAQWGSGVVSGALLTSTGLNGPPLVLTLQSMELPPRAFRGTLQRIFQGQDLVAVLAFVVVGRLDAVVALFALAGVASVPLGWACGDRLFARVSPERFRVVVLATLLATAGVSLVAAI